MKTIIGDLEFTCAKDNPELTSKTVMEAILNIEGGNQNNDKICVAEIYPDFSDTAQFCEKYKIDAGQVANCVILEAKRGERVWFAACLVLSNTKADVNGLARKTLDARRISFAPMEKAVTESSMEYGAITPIGLPIGWSILVDQSITKLDYVIIGSGIRKSKLAVPGSLFASLPNAQILDGLGINL
ncbi:MAG: YbaK/EbsC family protein [bacterium]